MNAVLANPRALPVGFDQLVYLRVVEACNLHCRHCFIPNNPKRLKSEQLARLPEQLRKLSSPGQTLLIQMHGGEPTLMGAWAMRELVEFLMDEVTDRQLRFSIQTNLINFNEEWAALYHDCFNAEVGVSWDVDIRQLKRGDPDSNKLYEKHFWSQMEWLQSSGLNPYLVITATRLFFERFKHPSQFFEFLTDRDIHYAHIERLTPTGYALDNWDEIGVNNYEYAYHMARFSRAYRLWNQQQTENHFPRLNLSPFDGLFESAASLKHGQPQGYGCWSGSCDTRFHTIDAYGYTPGCTALTAGRSATKSEVVPLTFYRDKRQERRNPCQDCEYRSICSSGCLGLDALDDSGECTGGKHLFQTVMTMV